MASCTQCGAYTKFEGGLCLKCYHAKNGKKEKDEIEELLEELNEAPAV